MKYLFIILLCLLCKPSEAQQKLSLDDAVKSALKGNFSLIKSEREADAARGRFWSSISLPKPVVSLSHEFVPKGKGLSFFNEKSLEISQEIEFPTNIFLKGSRSNYEIELLDYEKERAAIEVTSKVKLLYRDAVIKGKKTSLAEDNYAIAIDFYDKAEARLKAGEGTKLESITAKMQLNEARVSLESARNEYRSAVNRLLETMNRTDLKEEGLTLTDSLTFHPVYLKFDELLNEAMANNKLIKKSESSLGIASINKTLAWSSLLPNLSFSYFRQATPDNDDFYGVSFGISLPVWFLFEQRGNIQEAAANYSIAGEEVKTVRNSVELNLKSSFSSFRFEQEQIKTYMNDLLPQAAEVFDLARLSYNSGEINYIEFLQAKQNLISIRNNYLNSLAGYYASLSELEITVGKNLL